MSPPVTRPAARAWRARAGWIVTLGVIAANLVGLVPRLQQDLGFIARHPDLSPAEKLRSIYGRFHDLVELIRRTTPETSTILIPALAEADPWPDAANEFLLRSFLYPRALVRVSGTEWSRVEPAGRPVFVLVLTQESPGRTDTWPATRPPEESIVFAPSGWGYARVASGGDRR